MGKKIEIIKTRIDWKTRDIIDAFKDLKGFKNDSEFLRECIREYVNNNNECGWWITRD